MINIDLLRQYGIAVERYPQDREEEVLVRDETPDEPSDADLMGYHERFTSR